jgi:small subunit ribosomal protein S8
MRTGSTNFVVGQTLSVLKRGIITSRKDVLLVKSKFNFSLLILLYRKGFIEGFELLNSFQYRVCLKYWQGKSLIKDLRIISKPSRRVFLDVVGIKNRLMSGRLSVFSTSQGFLTSIECLYLNIGGEILFEIIF